MNIFLSSVFIFILLSSSEAFSHQHNHHGGAHLATKQSYRDGYLFVAFDADITPVLEQNILSAFSFKTIKRYKSIPGLQLLELPNGIVFEDVIKHLQALPEIRYVEPDFIVDVRQQATFPNDPNFSNQWGLHNTGQVISGDTGTVDIDIDAPEAWDIQTGDGSCIAAIIDTGVEYTHPDLAANIWANTGEIIDGIDNDLNGYIDDIRGWDFADNDNDPRPSAMRPLGTSGHGTGVAGVAGAVGNNSIGIAGVAWNMKIMPLKYLPDDPADPVFLSYFINAIDYAYNNGALVSNHSYSLGGTFFLTLKDAIDAAGTAGHLVVAAAGASSVDQDISPNYPSSYISSNLISVTSIDNQGNLSPGANFGAVSIDLGAPGQNINTTWQGGGYVTNAGTSFAAPHVTGAACLIAMENPALTITEIQNDILNNTADNDDLAGASTTGGILNLFSTNTLPVTLSHFDSTRRDNRVEVNWSTSSELFNVGFQLWGLDGSDGQWDKLHNRLIRSGSGNAVEPQSYRKRVRLPKSIEQLTAIGVSSVDSDGSEHYYGPFNVGQSYGDLSNLEPIQWNHIRAEVDAKMASNGYVKDQGKGYRKASISGESTVSGPSATDQVVEFNINEDGLYRVTSSELLTDGIDLSDIANGDIALLDHQGNAVVRYVAAKGKGRGLTKTLGTGGELYFYGQTPDERDGLYTESSVYRLALDSTKALNAQTQRKQGVKDGFSDQYIEHTVVENDALYVLASAADDPWISRVVVGYTDQPSLYGIQVPVEADALWDQSSTLLLGLGRSSHLPGVDSDGDGIQDAEHIVEGLAISSSNELVHFGQQSAVGQGLWDVEFEIPGDTSLALTDSHAVIGAGFNAGAGYAFSEVHVDSMGLAYARPTIAKAGQDHLFFRGSNTGEAGYEVTVPNYGSAVVFASDGGNLVRIMPESQQRIKNGLGEKQRVVKFAGLNGVSMADAPVRYWVSSKRGYLSIDGLTSRTIPTQASLLAQTQGSDYVMIAHPAFMGADSSGVDHLSTYAAFKQSQGYTVSTINYLDIVDSFGGGQAGPHGLTRYLQQVDAQSNIDNVLIVGGSTYDHTDNLNTGAITFIPGHYGSSNYSNYTVSDVPYIQDQVGELFASIGRWPVRSMADLQTIVDKSLVWGQAVHAQGEVLMIAENTLAGENINFGAALDSVAGTLPSDWTANNVYVDEILAANPSLTQAQAFTQAKSEIIDHLNAVPELVLFNGHADTRQLSNNGLFKSSHIAQVTTPGAEVWVPLSCYVTFYENTYVNTLAHQLLFTGNAVAISGAMLLSDQSGNIAMGEAILGGVFNEGQTLGAAVNQSKIQINNPQLDINWALLGDPTVSF